MKILVTVKEVAKVIDDFEIEEMQIPHRYLEYNFNEWDEYALEEAVRISESEDDVEVVTATIGPERCEETIRMALAKGADRAIRVWDDALEDVDLLDVDAKAEILAKVINRENPDLVLTGVQANDDNFGATGVMLAERIGYEWAAVVSELDLDWEGDVASIHREMEGGVEELVDVDLPAVLTIQTGINEPRYASLSAIRQAQNKDLVSEDFAELGLSAEDAKSALTLSAMYEPETQTQTEIWKREPEETAGVLAEFLREKEVVNV